MADTALVSSCPFCGGPDLIVDTIEGTHVCRSCAFELQGRLLSDAAEWRTFKDEPQKNQRAAFQKTNAYLSASANLTTHTVNTGSKVANALFLAGQKVHAAADAQVGIRFSSLPAVRGYCTAQNTIPNTRGHFGRVR